MLDPFGDCEPKQEVKEEVKLISLEQPEKLVHILGNIYNCLNGAVNGDSDEPKDRDMDTESEVDAVFKNRYLDRMLRKLNASVFLVDNIITLYGNYITVSGQSDGIGCDDEESVPDGVGGTLFGNINRLIDGFERLNSSLNSFYDRLMAEVIGEGRCANANDDGEGHISDRCMEHRIVQLNTVVYDCMKTANDIETLSYKLKEIFDIPDN
jgi:hypothetical protein